LFSFGLLTAHPAASEYAVALQMWCRARSALGSTLRRRDFNVTSARLKDLRSKLQWSLPQCSETRCNCLQDWSFSPKDVFSKKGANACDWVLRPVKKGVGRRHRWSGKRRNTISHAKYTSPTAAGPGRFIETGSVHSVCFFGFGGPGEIRTLDLFHAMEARSQLRHRPTQEGLPNNSIGPFFFAWSTPEAFQNSLCHSNFPDRCGRRRTYPPPLLNPRILE
jgi:hypothetical protein